MKEARIFLAIICLIYIQCGIVSVHAANTSVLYKKSTLSSKIQKSGKTKIRPLYAMRVRTLRVASTPVALMATPGVSVPASTTSTPVIDTIAPVYTYTTPIYTAPTPTVTTPTPSTPVVSNPSPTPATPTPTTPINTPTPTTQTPVVTTPVTPTPSVPTPPTPVVVSRSAKITYRSPGGDDDMTFSVTSTDGIITSATSIVESFHPESIKYQQRFASAMPSIVIGKKISGFSISTIGGASLTTNAFKKFITSNF